jgi:hypothetical protein
MANYKRRFAICQEYDNLKMCPIYEIDTSSPCLRMASNIKEFSVYLVIARLEKRPYWSK